MAKGVLRLKALVQIGQITVTEVFVKVLCLLGSPEPQLEEYAISDDAQTIFGLVQFPCDVQHSGNTEPFVLQGQLVEGSHVFEVLEITST